jgi:hypothetical protein
VNLLGGYWYAFDDTGSGFSYTDPVSDNRAILDGIPTVPFTMKGYDYTTNTYGGAAKITGAVKDTATFLYGFVGMGTNLNKDKTPMSIACCSGIRFYARSTSGTMTSFRMKLAHPTAFPTPSDSENMFGKVFTVSSTWTLIDIPLSSLTQLPYWGTTIPLATALAAVEAIQFQSTAPDGTSIPSLALEVDDLTLYNCVGGCMPTPVPTNTKVVVPTPTITPTPNVPLVDYLVDNCDDGNNANNLGGYWYTFDDAGTSATHSYVWPMSDKYGVIHAVPTYAFIMSTPGYGSTGYAAQMTGTTTSELLSGTSYYDFIGMGTNLAEPKAAVNLNCCGGIRFYAKTDSPSVMSSFRVKLGATGAYASAGGEGGDMYGKVFTVTGAWQLFEIPFSTFTAEGWGATTYGASQPSLSAALTYADSIQFQSTGQGKVGIDLWIDGLYLTNCYPGCVNALVPTSTNTPVVPTVTFTVTPTITTTPTNVPVGSTVTDTPTVTPTNAPVGSTDTVTPTMTPVTAVTPSSNTLSFTSEKNIKSYPNPAFTSLLPVTFSFKVSKSVTEVKIKLFTSALRFIREADVEVSLLKVVDSSSDGITYEAAMASDFISTLSKGTYYYVIEAKDSNTQVKSKIEKLIKLY